ncbi:hypothetical protein LPJ56_000831 [Coemansia sp. RSA 2599]|nr:hypothetical protein LPJ56_000831 [Coemansia sp. RSA 2599]
MAPLSAGEGFPSASNIQSSPVVGGPLRGSVGSGSGSGNSSQQHLPCNYSSSSVFAAAQSGALPAAPSGYSATHGGSSNACNNLPPLVAPSFQRSPAGLSMAPLITPTSSSVSLPQQQQQQHTYHQQRHLLHMAAGPTRMPIDSNITPRLTTATTATPTPGSTSAQLGSSHSLDNANASGNAVTSSSAASTNVAALAGSYKLAGRSLPSLILPAAANNPIPHVGTISNGLARTSLGDASLGHQQHQSVARSGYYQQLPSAQTLMQSPTQQQAPGSMAMDYAGSHYHHHHYAHHHQQQQQQPSSATNNTGY